MLDSIIAVLERLSSPRIAATAALTSFLVLVVSVVLFIVQRWDRFSQIDLNSNNAPAQAIRLISSDAGSRTSAAISLFSITLIFSCCLLVIDFIRIVKDSFKRLNEELRNYLKKASRLARMEDSSTLVALESGVVITTFLSIFFDVLFILVFAVIVIVLPVLIISFFVVVTAPLSAH